MKKWYNTFKGLNKTDWLLFGLVMLVAIFFRFYRLGDVPLGLPADAGVNGGDAWRLLHRGGHTVFLAGNGGREAALMYLQAMAIAIFGAIPLAVRWPTALADTISVALTFWFARWLFQDLPLSQLSQTRWAATWAGLGMAVSHWLVVVSRLGLRAGLVPLFALSLFWSFLLAWRSGKIGWFILAGLFLGLSGYTYPAAKILPLVLILAVLPDLFKWPQLSEWKQGVKERGTENSPLPPCPPAPLLPSPPAPRLRTRLPGLAATTLIAALVYLPMLIYTVTHPAQVTNRPFSVAIWAFAGTPAELAAILWDNLILTAGFFCCRGNEHLILFGLPGRAAQDIVLGLLLLTGIGLCLRGFGRLEPRLLVIWFLLALIPTLLTTEAPHPLRLIAAAPAMVLLTVSGMHFVAQKRRWLSVVFTLWLIGAGGLTFRDYFVRWPARADTQAVFGYSQVEQAETIKARTREGEVIYIPQPLYVKPALHYYLNGSFPPQPRPAFNETTPQVTFLGELDHQVWVRLSSQGAQILPPLTQTARRLLAESRAGARIDARQLAWQEPALASLAPDNQIGPAKLNGATFSPVIPADGILEVTLFWEALTPMGEDYEILVHLLDDAGQGWSLDELAEVKDAYPTSYWRPGRDLVPDYHRLQLNDGLPLGRYWLAVSIFDPARGERLPVVAAKRQVAPDTLFLGPLKAPLPTFEGEVSELDFVADHEFAGLARLRGYNLSDQHLVAGQPLSVELIWQATAEVTTDYTVFVHLLDAGDNLVAGHDGQPVAGRYPTTIWSVGEFIPDPHVIDTTAVPPGQYHLAVGLYNFATGERVPVTGSADGRAILAAPIVVE